MLQANHDKVLEVFNLLDNIPREDTKLQFRVEDIISVLPSLQWSPTKRAAFSNQRRRDFAFATRLKARVEYFYVRNNVLRNAIQENSKCCIRRWAELGGL